MCYQLYRSKHDDRHMPFRLSSKSLRMVMPRDRTSQNRRYDLWLDMVLLNKLLSLIPPKMTGPHQLKILDGSSCDHVKSAADPSHRDREYYV